MEDTNAVDGALGIGVRSSLVVDGMKEATVNSDDDDSTLDESLSVSVVPQNQESAEEEVPITEIIMDDKRDCSIEMKAEKLEDHSIVTNDATDPSHGSQDLTRLKNTDTIKKLASLMSATKSKTDKKVEETIKEVRIKTAPVERSTYGLNLEKLRAWSREVEKQRLDSEAFRQTAALGQMKGFMHAILLIVKLQNWWRMLRSKAKFAEWRKERNEVKSTFFRAWRIFYKSERMFYRIVVGKPLHAWIQEIADQKRLSALVAEFFKISIARSRLTPQVPSQYDCPYHTYTINLTMI